MFLQVLRRKQWEAAAHSGGAAAGETLEELTAAELVERCAEEVVVEVAEERKQQANGEGDRAPGYQR